MKLTGIIAISLVLWLEVYALISGFLIGAGIPLDIMKYAIGIKDLLFFLLFTSCLITLKDARVDKLMIYFSIFILIMGIYLLVSSYPLSIRLRSLRYYLYIMFAYFGGRYAFRPSISELHKMAQIYIGMIAVLSIWSVTTRFAIGYDKFFLATKYLLEYGKITTYDDFYFSKIYQLIGIGYNPFEYRLLDLNGSFLTFGNKLAYALITIVVFRFNDRTIYGKKYDIGMLLLISTTLILSNARAATVATIALVGYYSIFLKKRGRIYLVAYSVLVILAMPIIYHMYERLFFELKYFEPIGHVGGWLVFLSNLVERPFGYGLGSGEEANPLGLEVMSGEMMQGTILVELGIGGLFVFSMIVYNLIKSRDMVAKIDNGFFADYLMLTPMFYFLVGLTKFDTLNYINSIMVFFICGYMIALYEIEKKKTAKKVVHLKI